MQSDYTSESSKSGFLTRLFLSEGEAQCGAKGH